MAQALLLRPALILAAVAAAWLAASCSAAHHVPQGPGRHGLLLERDSSNGTTVRVRPGRRITLILSSSYWTINGSSAPAIVRQDGPTTSLPAPPGGCVPGGGCDPLRTYFTALKPGRAVITAHRLSCGEALLCAPSQRHFRLTLVVS